MTRDPPQALIVDAPDLECAAFRELLVDSGLGARSAVDDPVGPWQRCEHGDLRIPALFEGELPGLACSLRQAHCCWFLGER